MSTPIILIDGYNLLFRHEQRALESKKGLRDFRFDLLRQLNEYRVKTGKYRIWIVFDSDQHFGFIQKLRARSVQVMFTNRKVDADSYIAHLCQEHAGKAYLVTSDRGLRARTVQNVIRIIDSQEFLDKYLYPMVDINSIVPTARPVQIDQ